MTQWHLHGEADVEIVDHPQPQRTIESLVSFSGFGLHSGSKALFSVAPAPVDYGIRFDTEPMDAAAPRPAFVYSNDYTTTAVTSRLRIQCVEHLMSALHGLGIVNAHVRCLEGDEFPVLDGSAGEICSAFRGVGIRTQGEPCRMLRIRAPFSLSDPSGLRTIACAPARGLTVRADIDFPPPIGKQSYEIACTPDSFCREIAPARTFLQNSVVDKPLAGVRETRLKGLADPCPLIHYDDREFLCDLRFRDEPVRHKILDFLGDVFTIGMPLEGRIHLTRPGHAVTRKLVEVMTDALQGRAMAGAGQPTAGALPVDG